MPEREPWVAAGVGPVADAFGRNFDDPDEDAAAVAVLHLGVLAVDLWAGTEVGFGYLCSRMRNISPAGDPRWRTVLDPVARCAGGIPASESDS